MGSSSDIEFVEKPATGRGARTRKPARPRAEVRSPAAKRVASKPRVTAAPKAGKGKAKAQAISDDDEGSDADLLPSPGPASRKQLPSKPGITTLDIVTSDTVGPEAFSSDPPPASVGAQLPRSASASAVAGPSAKRVPSFNSQSTIRQTTTSQSPAPSRSELPKSSSAPTMAKRVPAPKRPIPQNGNSSDETDDFFVRKPAAVAAPKRVPGRRPASSQVPGSSGELSFLWSYGLLTDSVCSRSCYRAQDGPLCYLRLVGLL